jgi:hypothetical protein
VGEDCALLRGGWGPGVGPESMAQRSDHDNPRPSPGRTGFASARLILTVGPP